MAVSIHEMISTVEADEPAAPGAAPGAREQTGGEDEVQFGLRYGAAVRSIVREEIERWLRLNAD